MNSQDKQLPDISIRMQEIFIVVNIDEGIEVECFSEMEMRAKIASYNAHGIGCYFYKDKNY